MKTAREVIDDPNFIQSVERLLQGTANGRMCMVMIVSDGENSCMASNFAVTQDLLDVLNATVKMVEDRDADRVVDVNPLQS